MILELIKADLSVAAAKSASAAQLALTRVAEGDGVLLIVRPGEWSQALAPAAATQATTTKAAGGVGVRHVCTSISATFSTGATGGSVGLLLRDGASGAGTQLVGKQVVLPANAVWEVNLSGLNIVGSANTAMTLEFSAAGPAASLQSVSMTGYDIA